MRTRFTLTILAVAALASCENNPLLDDNGPRVHYAVNEISFVPTPEEVLDPTSRGTPITNSQQMTDMGVFCASTGLNDWTASATPNKMFNIKVIRNTSSGLWQYTGAPVYWGATNGNDRYSFFAYAPYASAQNGITIVGGGTTSGVPQLNYTTPVDVTQQPDLMLASPRYNLRPSSSMVALQMKHALTCVGFQLQGNGEKVKSIAIAGVYSSGTVTLNGGNVVWSSLLTPPVPTNYSAAMNFDAGQSYYTAKPTLSTNLIAGNGYLMLIPQVLGTSAKLILTLSDNSTREINLNTQTWVAGKKITYNIIITPAGIITITPSECLIPAIGVGAATDNLALSCNPINMNWTLSTTVTWLRMSKNADGSAAATTITGQGPMTIYTIVDANATLFERTAPIHAQGTTTQAVGTIQQMRGVALPTLIGGGEMPVGVTSYVGAFWRANQTGERIIRIPVGNTTNSSGLWCASVVWMDGNWQKDDIRFSIAQSPDTTISYTSDSSPADAENYDVLDAKTTASGNVPVNGIIYFRIGLKSEFAWSAATPARYALIALSYKGRARTQYIFVRQGHEPDYVMRTTDPSTGSFISASRPMARKISPYNLTQSTLPSWPGGSALTSHPLLLARGGVFTEYPSQAGALFQWASTDLIRKAYHPTSAETGIVGYSSLYLSSFWQTTPPVTNLHETCPAGYKRMNDGPETVAVTMTASNSEARQSLLDVLLDEASSSRKNAEVGYYADGFFDRRQIKTTYNNVPAAVVSYFKGTSNPLNAKVAYKGVLAYNPITCASVFFPLCGGRIGAQGALEYSGTYGLYWSASTKGVPHYASGLLISTTSGMMFGFEYTKITAGPIRCVKIP